MYSTFEQYLPFEISYNAIRLVDRAVSAHNNSIRDLKSHIFVFTCFCALLSENWLHMIRANDVVYRPSVTSQPTFYYCFHTEHSEGVYILCGRRSHTPTPYTIYESINVNCLYLPSVAACLLCSVVQ